MADCRQVHAGRDRAALREPRQIDRRAAADLEDRFAPIRVEIDQPQQVMEFLEMVLVEILEEPRRSDRMLRDLQIVNMPFPVPADVVDRRHRG